MIQKTFLPIINYIARITQKINDRVRTFLLYLCVFAAIISIYIYQVDEFLGFVTPAAANALIGTICFVGIIVFGISSEMEHVNIRRLPVYLLMVCGLLIFISGFHHYIGYSYMLMGLFMVFLAPAFFLVWSRNINSLLKITACINVMLFTIFFIINCIVAPLGDWLYMISYRYFGITSDPNGMAKLSVSAVVCSIYLLSCLSGKIRYILLPVLSMAITLIYLTISRTNMIAFLLIAVFTLIIALKNTFLWSDDQKKTLLSLFAMCLVIGLLIPAALKCCELGYISEVQTDTHADSIVTRTTQGVSEDGSVDFNAASSGRLTIWKYCIDNLSIIGESPQDGIMIDLGRDHVHNTVLEISYRSGVFAGICFFLIELICCIWIVRILFSRRKTLPQELFAALSITAFGFASLFDIVVLPFAKITVFLFYISLPVIMILDKEK